MAYVPPTRREMYEMRMRREREDKLERARKLFNQGMSLYEIAEKVNLPERVLVMELGLG